MANKKNFPACKSVSVSFTKDEKGWIDMGWKKMEKPVECQENEVRRYHVKKPFKDILRDIEKKAQKKRKRSNSSERLPSKSPPYPYKRNATRKKSERRKLPGQVCDYCYRYYESLYRDGYTEEEIEERLNKYSKHRDKYPIRSRTPPGFWDPVFPECD